MRKPANASFSRKEISGCQRTLEPERVGTLPTFEDAYVDESGHVVIMLECP
jgi:hypothetical protein